MSSMPSITTGIPIALGKHLKFVRENILDIRCGNYENHSILGGTGFLFQENFILTCYHCIGDRKTGELYENLHIANIGDQDIQITVIKELSSIEHDYAVLYIDNPNDLALFDIEIIEYEDTTYFSHGFSELNQYRNRRDNTPFSAIFIAEMELPASGHPRIYAFETPQQAILNGQSGSPICIYDTNKQKIKTVAMCQGYAKLAGFEQPKMYALPLDEVMHNKEKILQEIRRKFEEDYSFTEIYLNETEKYFITLKVLTTTKLNKLFGIQLLGINAYIAQSFAKLLGFSLPTEKQWTAMFKAGKILPIKVLKKDENGRETIETQKEWVIGNDILNNGQNEFLLASVGKNQRSFENQRPEANDKMYVFRLVSSEPV